ncbi:MAG: PQQ-dependent sugar dehydrogenase [Nocardioidaceae bacterium]|nr:PQQ-dependent sugar dehydrogenase [Nocardioidaceae bacterium]
METSTQRGRRIGAGVSVAVLFATGLTASGAATVEPSTRLASPAPTAGSSARALSLRVTVAERGLDIPWDVAVLPNGDWLVTERDRQRILLRTVTGRLRVLAAQPAGFWSSGETGLMSIAADPSFVRNSRFYVCTGYETNGRHGIRVIAWKLNARHTDARRVETLLRGIQITSGRHGGCRLRFGRSGALYVGTGDSAVTSNAQNRQSLNGKVLRLNRFTGRAWPTNPFTNADNRKKRFVFTYGHRNVQGLALRPGGVMWSVEHGTYRDDEVNKLVPGGNYGWRPGPGYDESRPMTDYRIPGRQRGAKWRSGYPTIATSGATWVRGRQWGAYRGALAVCALGGERLLFLKFGPRGALKWARAPDRLRGDYGRLRSVKQVHGGPLLVTTSNGGGGDKILRVSPVR